MSSNIAPRDRLDRPIGLAVIVASTREGRRGRALTDWLVARMADRPDIVVDEIDLDDLDLPTRFGFGANAAVEDLRRRVDEADAFLVVTPEYNHSYPASLKHAIDFVKDPWKRKPVGFVSYGGVSGGLRAVEHLRGVFNELHAHGIR
ncbi:MAG: NAD(P)H-dependent oxidoreductase, partial [Ilumatobacter sp.]